MPCHHTEVREMKLREPSLHDPLPPQKSKAQVSRVGKRILFWDRLIRDTAVVGALLLLLVAMRNSSADNVRAVFDTIQADAGMEWDESLGKLSFVSDLLPESLQAVWNDSSDALVVYAPCSGSVVHAWSESEPYMELATTVKDIHAAQNGEVMSIAHGYGEELIARLRHDDGTETLYGNLSSCVVSEGDYVYAGDALGELTDGKALCFELRRDGRSIDPQGYLREAEEHWN